MSVLLKHCVIRSSCAACMVPQGSEPVGTAGPLELEIQGLGFRHTLIHMRCVHGVAGDGAHGHGGAAEA